MRARCDAGIGVCFTRIDPWAPRRDRLPFTRLFSLVLGQGSK